MLQDGFERRDVGMRDADVDDRLPLFSPSRRAGLVAGGDRPQLGDRVGDFPLGMLRITARVVLIMPSTFT